MTKTVGLLGVVLIGALALGAGCASTPQPRMRPDDALTRLLPSEHTMAPIHPTPTAVLAAALPERAASQRFTAEHISVEEPSFHELHSLAWQRQLRDYTASALNRATAELPAGPPLETRARFTWTRNYRNSAAGGERVTIMLETALPDGRIVASKDVDGEVGLWNEVGPETALAFSGETALGAALGVNLSMLVLVASTSPVAWALLGASLAVAATAGVTAVVVSVMRVSAVEQRWSDLYLKALRTHAADVRAVLLEGGVPKLTESQ